MYTDHCVQLNRVSKKWTCSCNSSPRSRERLLPACEQPLHSCCQSYSLLGATLLETSLWWTLNYQLIVSVFERHISAIREVALFRVWLLLLNTVNLTHVVARGDSSVFSLLYAISLYEDTTIYLSSLSSFDVALEGICPLRVWANDVSVASLEACCSGEEKPEKRLAVASCWETKYISGFPLLS